jgi:hypothetical protein
MNPFAPDGDKKHRESEGDFSRGQSRVASPGASPGAQRRVTESPTRRKDAGSLVNLTCDPVADLPRMHIT